jgi:hypothetical protein
MTTSTIERSLRGAVVAAVVFAGLFASTPNVHGTAETRGGAACDVNKSMNISCGDTGYSGKCLYLYTVCYSVPGWRYMTCVLKPIQNNQCEKDAVRCFPRDDYMPVAACTASYQAAGAALNSSAAPASRVQ